MKLNIFISYKREDQAFAMRLHQELVKWGFAPWIDQIDIPSGANWDDAIYKALRASQIVIGVLTPEALKSENVLDEWGWALTNNRRLILLWYRGISSEEDIPHRYSRKHRIDLRKDEVAGLRKLQQALGSSDAIFHSPIEDLTATSLPSESAENVSRRRKSIAYRDGLIKRVEKNWIQGVLDKALELGQFELGIAMASPNIILKHNEYGDYQLPSSSNILEIFDVTNRKLLILGTPGSGKTVLLLQLTQALISEARNNRIKPVPVVFNLSSWGIERKPLLDWFTDELNQKYEIELEISVSLVENTQIVFLLDGLDEVNPDYQEECIDAINEFYLSHKSANLAVCSRIADYDALTKKLSLESGITLQPLTKDQIDAFLIQFDLESLRSEMQNDQTLLDMAETPFLLNTMVYAYRGISVTALKIDKTGNLRKSRQNHLFTEYIRLRLLSAPTKDYSPSDTERYLSWLANRMVELNQTIFHIRYLDTNWLTSQQQKTFETTQKFVYAGGIVAMMTSFFVTGPIGAIVELAGPVAFSLGYLLGFQSKYISLMKDLTDRIVNGELETEKTKTLVNELQDLVRVSTPLIKLPVWYSNEIMRTELIRELVKCGIHKRSAEKIVDKILFGSEVPLEKNSLKALAKKIVRANNSPLFSLQTLAILLSLNIMGLVPLNYSKFLDYAVSVGLLRKVGDGYIFAHRYLLEYFATRKF